MQQNKKMFIYKIYLNLSNEIFHVSVKYPFLFNATTEIMNYNIKKKNLNCVNCIWIKTYPKKLEMVYVKVCV